MESDQDRIEVPDHVCPAAGGITWRTLSPPNKLVSPLTRVTARRRGPGSRSDEAGFTLVEVLVAITLLAILLVGLAGEGIDALSTSSYANQRSVAAGLISGAMAQVTALPFADLQAGLNPADSLAGDPNVTQSGNGYIFAPSGATLATSGTSTSEPPLVPHVTTVTVGIPYHVAVYPTVSASSPGLVTVTVIVTWSSSTVGSSSESGVTQVAAP